MSSEETPIESREEFNAELSALLRKAYENDIDVKGGYDCRNGADYPNWDVIVTEVEKNEQSE